MRLFRFVALSAVILAGTAFVSCTDEGPTTPDPIPTAPVAAPAPTPEPASTSPTAPTGVDIKIHDSGKVVNNTGDTYTACLFHKPFGAGKLVDEWKAKPGTTQSDYKTPGCDPSIGQIELITQDRCPPTPHGLSPVAANPNIRIPAAKTGEQCTECTPGEWEEVEGSRLTSRTQWGECPETRDGHECFECRRIRSSWTETNGCEERKQNSEEIEQREIPCETECEVPDEGTTLSWTGAGDPQTECQAFGLYDAIEAGSPDFFICKAGNDREVWYSEPGAVCLNGKDRSHTTLCVCSEPV